MLSIEDLVRPDYVFVVAEIGINHNGNLDTAKRLIDVAIRSGCDAVKFQKRTLDIVYSPEALAVPRDSPWGTTTREQKEGLEFGQEDYVAIDAYCREMGIPWSASAWDIPSQDFLGQFDLPFNKVASAMITHLPFVERVASERRTTLMSTGMAGEEEVERALAVFRAADCPVILMHTVSVYPCPESLLNLAAIPTMSARFGVPVGYSGHESTVMPTIAAATMGARIVERHVTLDRAMYGSDQAASLAPRGLLELVDQLRRLPGILGDGKKAWVDGERGVASKLRYWETL